jgi:ABC-type transport system involved in multi-copper enzyme maturation permease subunit
MGAFVALTLNAFREARRNRVTLAVGLFAAALLIASSLVTEVTVVTFDRVLTDVGIGGMSIMLAVLAVFLSSSQLSREIERRTIFVVVSKPISRSMFLLARFAGNMLTLAVLLIAMGGIFAVVVLVVGNHLTAAQFTAISMLWTELLVLSAVGFLFSSFASQYVSALVTVSIYFAGHLSADIYDLAQRAKQPLLRWLCEGVYYVLPNLSRLNYRPRATYNVPASASLILDSTAYAFCYTGVLLALAALIFSRRDFK